MKCGVKISGCCDNPSEYKASALPFCHQLYFVCRWQTFVGRGKAWFKFRKVADRICEKYGLYYDPNPNRSKQSDYLTMKEKAGMPTRYSVAKEAIDYAIDHSKTLKEFQFALKEMGYAYNLSPSRKYWTVIPKGYDKPIRLKNLGADYTNDRIVERIKENRDRWAEIEPFQRAIYKPRQYRMQTRGQKLKKERRTLWAVSVLLLQTRLSAKV